MLSDGEHENALQVAREAVRQQPGEMKPWLLMTTAYCRLKAWDMVSYLILRSIIV
jgi:cytochrome c-type biogenesis protein CcmH/NrfG